MSVGIVDTTVILHYFRQNEAARAWVNAQPVQLALTSITWMEVLEGVSSKQSLKDTKALLNSFELLHLTITDQQWAMDQLERFRFTHHLDKDDCLIASIAHRLQIPLYTHNLKDVTPLIGSLAVKPYP